MTSLNDLKTPCPITWCPGCGNFGTLMAFKNAAVKAGWDNTNSVFVTGIGCHGHISDYLKITSVETLHGRSLPLATGIKLANHKLNVFVFVGDGDGVAEGGNHLIHAARRNHNLTVLLQNNGLFSLTTGQASPLTPLSTITKSTPYGNIDYPFQILNLGLAAGATFVARGFSGDIKQLTELIIAGANHKGFSIIEVLQPCPTFNEQQSFQFYKDNIYYLPVDYNCTNIELASQKVLEWGIKQIPLGIIYQDKQKPSYEAQVKQLADLPLIKIPLERNINGLFEKYT